MSEFAAENGDVLLDGVDAPGRAAALGQLNRVQRLFRLTSGPELLKAMLDAGFDSARSIARLSPAVFSDRLGSDVSDPQKRLAYQRAVQISDATIHASVLLNDAMNGAAPDAVMGAADQPQVQATMGATCRTMPRCSARSTCATASSVALCTARPPIWWISCSSWTVRCRIRRGSRRLTF